MTTRRDPPVTDRLFVRLDEDDTHGPETAPPPGSLQSIPVSPRLQPYVSHVLLYRESVPDGSEIVERVIPDGALRLVVNLGDLPAASGTYPLGVIGPSASPALVRLRGTVHGLSVTLRAGAALALFGVPASELSEAQVPLEAMWGRQAAVLRERLLEAADDAARGVELQAVLQGRVEGAAPPARRSVLALQQLVARADGDTVRRLARAAGLGERRLQQLFRADVGLSPRTWRRLSRIHQCIRGIRGRQRISWADVAAAYGFYDQPHLIREFQHLCGCTPAEFVRQSISHSSNRGAPRAR